VIKEVRDMIDGVYDPTAERVERKAASDVAEYEVMS
jgi:hypothetical protein